VSKVATSKKRWFNRHFECPYYPNKKSAAKQLSCKVAPRNQQRKPNGSKQYTFATNSVAANVGIEIKQTANSKVRQRKPLLTGKQSL
jgi:hypothetical protein